LVYRLKLPGISVLAFSESQHFWFWLTPRNAIAPEAAPQAAFYLTAAEGRLTLVLAKILLIWFCAICFAILSTPDAASSGSQLAIRDASRQAKLVALAANPF
jgi:hypothetical protein